MLVPLRKEPGHKTDQLSAKSQDLVILMNLVMAQETARPKWYIQVDILNHVCQQCISSPQKTKMYHNKTK